MTMLCIMVVITLNAQESKHVQFEVFESKAVLLGKTFEVRDLAKNTYETGRKKPIFKKNRKKPDDFKNRRGFSKAVDLEKEHQGADPLRQKNSSLANSQIIEPKVNINGIGNNGSPMDPSGEIGLDYYVQGVNVTDIGVFDKEGNLVQQFAAEQLWSSLGANSAGDPIILFDERANRWFITEFTGPANLLVAVSETSDPLGSYMAYSFSTPNFPDYPKYALWPEALVVTTNEQGAGTLHQYFIDREALLSGAATATMQRISITGNNNTEAGFYVSTPVDVDGDFPDNGDPIVMTINDSSWGAVAQDQLEIYSFDIDWANANNTQVTNLSLQTTPFDSYPCSAGGFGFACVPQSGGQGLDAVPEVIMNIPKLRKFANHESIVLSFVTDVTDGDNLSGIRWMELRRSTGSDWSIFQEGTYAPEDGLDRFMCSIAMDGNGNIGLGYNVTSPQSFVGVRYTGRYNSDPLGEMTVQEYNVVEGTNTINSFGRFGDYSHMSVDPVNESTFWFTTEYAGGGPGGVRTRIVAFELSRDSIDIAMSKISSPFNSAALSNSESVTIELTNAGENDVYDFILAYDFLGSQIEQVMITDTIKADSSMIYTFSNTIDLSAKGMYEITAYVSHPSDLRNTNDTIVSQISHLFSFDGSLNATAEATVCSDVNSTSVTLTNNGFETLQSAKIEVYINGELKKVHDWSGNLSSGSSETFDISFILTDNGLNDVELILIELNGNADEVASNNLATFDINLDSNLSLLTVEINTDEYPEETLWELRDANGNLIGSGGPYSEESTQYVQRYCVDEEACFNFTITDLAGDGICCGFGQGSYNVIDGNGDILITGGDFGSSESIDFCNVDCNLTANIVTTDSDATDNGTIMINVSGGAEPFSYSINGGNSFQTEALFTDLPAGDYDVVVTSNDGVCVYSETVTVQNTVSINEVSIDGIKISVIPNPNNGYFQLIVSNLITEKNFLHIDIVDARGRLVQTRKIGKFNDEFIGGISLVAYPSGLYYLKVNDKNINKAIRVSIY